MEKSWKEAIKRVMQESKAPLHYTEISDKILANGYYEIDGATPAATVNAQLAKSIKHDGEKSPLIRVGKGIFALTFMVEAATSKYEKWLHSKFLKLNQSIAGWFTLSTLRSIEPKMRGGS